jgi:hypothetical protein
LGVINQNQTELCSLAFKPTFAKMEVGEDATDATDATAIYTAAASTRNKTLATKKTPLPFAELLLQLHTSHGLQLIQS